MVAVEAKPDYSTYVIVLIWCTLLELSLECIEFHYPDGGELFSREFLP